MLRIEGQGVSTCGPRSNEFPFNKEPKYGIVSIRLVLKSGSSSSDHDSSYLAFLAPR